MTRPRSTHVYILGFSDGAVKVGRTSNVANRFLQLSAVARERNAVITERWSRVSDNAYFVEDVLKSIGRQFFTPAIGLEYFNASHADFIEKVKSFGFVWGIDTGTTECITYRPRSAHSYTVTDLGDYVGVPQKTIRRVILAGELKVGNPPFITADEVRDWLESLPHERPAKVEISA